MANTTYEIVLSGNGRYSVRVSSDDPLVAKAGIVWAKGVIEAMTPQPEPTRPAQRASEAGEPPVCPVHRRPMTQQQGKYGPFWSCHERDEQGTYCSYRPQHEQP